MGLRSRLRSWWRGVRGGAALDAEMEEEFRFHLEARAADLMREGLRADEAARRARLEFGSVPSAREHGRAARGLRLADELRSDVTYGVRGLVRNRGFALVAVLTLGLGMGATAAIFSALDAVLLRPLPFPRADRLVELGGVDVPFALAREKSLPELDDVQALDVFTHVAAYAAGSLNLSGTDTPRRIGVGTVTTDFFATVGVYPAFGRVFSAEEGVPNAPRVVIVSDALWRRHMGADRRLAGQTILLNGRPHDVVGVMPAGFAFPEEVEVWIPLSLPTTFASFEPFRGYMPSRIIARLAPGATLEQAQAAIELMRQPYLRDDRPSSLTAAGLAQPLRGSLVGQRRTVLLVLLGATSLVLLVACANVANLLLTRSWARRREMAVRAALGATPARVLRQLLAESVVLALAGGALGLVLAFSGIHLLDVLVPKPLTGATELRIDVRVLAFTATVSLLTGLAFGLLPALGARRTDAGEVLKSGGGAAGGRAMRVRRALVFAEITLAVLLLIGSALMLRSMHVLLSRDPGIDARGVATLELTLARPDYPSPEARRAFYEGVIARLEALPQVASAAAINELPLRGVPSISFTVFPEGRPPRSQDEMHMAYDLNITPGYFDAMGIRVLAGRAPRPRADTLSVREVAVNQRLAELFWPGEVPIGRFLEIPGDVKFEIVGVVADVLPLSLASEPALQAYYSLLDEPYGNAAIVVRGRGSARALARTLEETVRAAAPHQAVYNVRTMEQVMASSIQARRTNTWLIASFGALALVLAVVGVYGVIAFAVARRTREIGIRMALGARAAQVRWSVVRESLLIALAGVVAGCAGAWLLSRVLEGMVYGVGVRDPLAFIVAPLALLFAAMLAALVPAQRATRLDPVASMRTE